MTSTKYDHLQVMVTITGKFHQNPLKTVGGVAETRLTAEKLLKGHNSGKNPSSMTSIKYAHLQVMGTITKSLENCKRSCRDKIVSTDGWKDGRMDRRTDKPITIVPFDLRRGTKKQIES